MEIGIIEHLPSGAAVRFDAVAEDLEKRPTVLFVHGWKSTIFTTTTFTALREGLCALGINALSLSLRGHEEAFGDIERVSRDDHVQDYIEAISYLHKRREVDTKRLGVLASSYGGYMTAYASNFSGFKATVLRAPALYPDIGLIKPTTRYTEDAGVREWRNHFHTPSESKALESLTSYKGQLLIVAGGVDEDIPPQVIDSYVQAAKQATVERILLPNAGHVFRGEDRDQYISLAVEWLSRHLL